MNLAMLSGKHKTNCQFIACCINLGHNVQCIMNTDFRVVDVNMLVFKQKTDLISPGDHFYSQNKDSIFNGIQFSFVICF